MNEIDITKETVMARRSQQFGQSSMSKSATKETYKQLDALYQHCLSLIATSTLLGSHLKDNNLLSYVADLGALTAHAQKVVELLPKEKAALDAIHSKDKASRVKCINDSNVMTSLTIGGAYQTWIENYGRNTMVHVDAAMSLLRDAEFKQKNDSQEQKA